MFLLLQGFGWATSCGDPVEGDLFDFSSAETEAELPVPLYTLFVDRARPPNGDITFVSSFKSTISISRRRRQRPNCPFPSTPFLSTVPGLLTET